ncbi:MAG: hypothetical protein JWO93_837 [Micrococcaceae bacterium]|nr:hypothetical protein [Micrococcaceae bacterium]
MSGRDDANGTRFCDGDRCELDLPRALPLSFVPGQEAFEHGGELGHFLVSAALSQAVRHRAGGLRCPAEQDSTFVGQGKNVLAALAGTCAAGDGVHAVEIVKSTEDVAEVGAEALGEVSLAARTVLVQLQQHAKMVATNSEGLKLGSQGPEDRLLGPAQEDPEPDPGFPHDGRRRGGLHENNIAVGLADDGGADGAHVNVATPVSRRGSA